MARRTRSEFRYTSSQAAIQISDEMLRVCADWENGGTANFTPQKTLKQLGCITNSV